MATPVFEKDAPIVVSALRLRTQFGKLLRRIENDQRSMVIQKRGSPKAVLLSLQDYVKLAAPEPDILKLIGEESQRKGTVNLSQSRIEEVIRAARRTARQRVRKARPI